MDDIVFPHLNITIHRLDNVAFTVFGLSIYWYGVIITLGIAAGVVAAALNAKRRGLDSAPFLDFALYGIPAAVIGARLYYVAFKLDYYAAHPLSIINTREGGLAIYGGVIGAIIAVFVYTRAKRLDFKVFLDVGIVGLPIGQAIGRWGNFMNKEVFGGFTDNLFAMRVWQDYGYTQVHPVFLYESVWNLALFAVMLILSGRKKFTGEIALVYIFGYGLGRFWLEGIRDVNDQLLLFSTSGPPVSMLLAGGSALIAGAMLANGFVKAKRGLI